MKEDEGETGMEDVNDQKREKMCHERLGVCCLKMKLVRKCELEVEAEQTSEVKKDWKMLGQENHWRCCSCDCFPWKLTRLLTCQLIGIRIEIGLDLNSKIKE